MCKEDMLLKKCVCLRVCERVSERERESDKPLVEL